MLIKSGIEKKHIFLSVVKGQYKPGKAKLATIEFGINVAKVMGFIKEIVRVGAFCESTGISQERPSLSLVACAFEILIRANHCP